MRLFVTLRLQVEHFFWLQRSSRKKHQKHIARVMQILSSLHKLRRNWPYSRNSGAYDDKIAAQQAQEQSKARGARTILRGRPSRRGKGRAQPESPGEAASSRDRGPVGTPWSKGEATPLYYVQCCVRLAERDTPHFDETHGARNVGRKRRALWIMHAPPLSLVEHFNSRRYSRLGGVKGERSNSPLAVHRTGIQNTFMTHCIPNVDVSG